MGNNDFRQYLGLDTLTVSEAMQQINANRGGVLFLVDESSRLSGSLTDGDIRRFLLSGGQLGDPAILAANRSPKVAMTEEDAVALHRRHHFTAIPILDPSGVVLQVYIGKGENKKAKASLRVPVVINAGGKGTRLDPYTRILPKPLIPVGELPIVEHIMREYQSYDCNEFHIIVNYKRELMKAYFSECDRPYDITWYDENAPLGTGGGLSLLRGKMRETFFFTNCDNLLRANYESMLDFHRKNGNVITMICAYKSFSIPYGIVDMGPNGVIEGMKEKPLFSFLTNTGIYVVEPEVLEDIEDGVPIGFPDVVEKQRQKGRNVAVFPVSETEWMDMGQLSELEKMRERLYGE